MRTPARAEGLASPGMSPRVAWTARLGAFIAIGTSPAALMLGGAAADETGRAELAVGLAAGIVMLAALAGLQGSLGPRRGDLAAVLSGPLGDRAGARIASGAMLVMMLGWFGVNAGAGGAGAALLLGIPAQAGAALYGLALVAVVARGVGLLSRAALVTGLATIALAALGLWLARGGVDAPPADVPGADSWLGAATLVVGYGAAFALRAPDFTHDLARPRDAWLCATIGLGLPLVLLAPAGAVLADAAGTWRLADALEALGAPALGGAFVAIGFAGSAMTNLYSGTRALGTLGPDLGRWTVIGGVAAAGIVVAVSGLADRLVPFLVSLALTAPGLVVVCVLHAALGGRSHPILGVTSWIVGVGSGLALDLAGFEFALLGGLLVTAVVYAAPTVRGWGAWSGMRRRRAGGDTGA